jgi:hypothetical protein
VKDIELTRRELITRDAKGGRDRVSVLPQSLLLELRNDLDRVRAVWEQDTARQHPASSFHARDPVTDGTS